MGVHFIDECYIFLHVNFFLLIRPLPRGVREPANPQKEESPTKEVSFVGPGLPKPAGQEKPEKDPNESPWQQLKY